MEYISLTKAAKMMGVHPDSIRRWFDEGKLKGYKTPSKQRKISVESIQSILAGESSK